MAKSAKSRSKSLFVVGGAQGPGRGPKKGTGGRPPDQFTKFLHDLLYDDACKERLRAIFLSDSDNDRFLRAVMWAVERLYGKPAQRLEHGTAEGETIRVTLDLGGHEH